jgi:tripartite-type tricarboxylate transporter receptor subunit TctC
LNGVRGSNPRHAGQPASTKDVLSRRQLLSFVTGAAAQPLCFRTARAQTYPSRHVRLIVPFPPGGASDPVARVLANRLTEVWSQQVVVENKGGAGGNIGALAAVQSIPDGYTLFMSSSFVAINPFLYRSLPYDPIADLAPVTRLTAYTNVMVVPNSSPARSVREFIELAQSRSAQLSFASPGVGTVQHLCGELFKHMAGVELTHVPYRGGGPALNDLIPGRVDVMFATLPSALPQIRGGTIRALAVTSASRVSFVPDVATVAESGVPGFDVDDWHALFVPAKTPADIASKIHDGVADALAYPAVKHRLDELAIVPAPSTPAELASFIKSEMAKWGPVIREANIQPE